MASTDSALISLNFAPGFHREGTRYTEEGKWYDGDKIRFRAGKPENMRGYVKRVTTAFDGSARDLKTWSDNDTKKLAAFGTEKKFYVYDDTIGSNTDVTPIVSSTTFTSVFSTQSGSQLVEISSTNNGRSVGDYVLISSSTTIGGNVVLGTSVYAVVSVSGANEFYIQASTTAAGTSAAVGLGTGQFLLETGALAAIQGLGYGAGVYNAGTSTTGRRAWNIAASSSGITFLPTQWSIDTWGEDLLINRRGSQIYFWDRDAAATPQRAALVTASPTATDSILVSPNDRHVIALGTTGFAAAYSPLRVRWSDQEDYANWTPSVSSTSGEVDLTDGTRIVGAVRSRNQINIWTDKSLFGMTFVGRPFIFQFRQLGSNCGLIGPHGCVDFDGRTFWMSQDNFYMFDGQVKNLYSTVRRYVYDNINESQFDKVYAGVNSEFKEIVWLYPSKESTDCDSYVIYNPDENHWVYGTGKFTTFEDRNVFNNTITTSNDSFLYDNEPDDIFTADGVTIPNFIESSDFDFEEGLDIMFIDRIIPDYTINDGTINMFITTKQYPTGPETIKGPFTINAETRKVDIRGRGRQARVRVSCNSHNTSWRWGSVRLSGARDGRR
tara:strand:+ start:196 stop:2019 length:1824 start_codon:yes stop_codon:yes gene_type:complete